MKITIRKAQLTSGRIVLRSGDYDRFGLRETIPLHETCKVKVEAFVVDWRAAKAANIPVASAGVVVLAGDIGQKSDIDAIAYAYPQTMLTDADAITNASMGFIDNIEWRTQPDNIFDKSLALTLQSADGTAIDVNWFLVLNIEFD